MSAAGVPYSLLLRDVLSAVFVFYVVRYSIQMLNSLILSRRLPPGPRGFPILGALPLLGSMPHVALAKMAKKYGPVLHLKMGTCDMVVASTPEAAKAFLKTLDMNFSNRPPNAGATNLAYNAQDLVFADYGPRWKLLRKLSNLHFLGGKALEEWSDARTIEMGHMIHNMYKARQRQEVVVVPEMLNYAMANMIGQVFLGKRVFVTVGTESNEFKDMVVELMTTAGYFNFGDWIPSIAWMDLQGIEGGMKRLHKRFDLLITKMIDEHLAQAGSRKGQKDFLDVLLEHRAKTSEGERLSITNIKALVLNLFTAGSDTSSSIIEWAMAEMLDNPTILKRAQEEMDRVIGRERRIQESDLSKLPYFQAICKETFRKHPSTPLNLPRVSSEACMVNGYYIPKNTRLSVNIWAIGRDPNVWEDPSSFNPDRFMSGRNAKIDPRGNDFELIPFGAGRRICAGTRMGVLMVELILGTLVHSFDWRMPDGAGKMNMDEVFGLALQKAVPLAAMVTPRLPAEVYAEPN